MPNKDNESSNHRIIEPPKPRRSSLFPKSLTKALEPVVKPVYKQHGFSEHRILTEWHLIVGAELAKVSAPQKITGQRGQGGTLYVLVAAARALELQHMEPQILERIASYFGHAAIKRLHFTQGTQALLRPAPPEKKHVQGGLRNDLSPLAAECEDEELRKALISLGKAIAAVEN